MSLHDVWRLDFDFPAKKAISVEPGDELRSKDGGLLLIRQFDKQHMV